MSSHRIGPRTLAITTLALALIASGCGSESPGGPSSPNPPAPTVTGVTINASATTVNVGATLQLQASVQPAAVAQSVTWTSSDVTRASVNGSGLVTGVVPGTVTITAASTVDPTRTGTVQLTVVGCTALAPSAVINGATLAPNTCYLAALPLAVNAGTLRLGAGVRIEFAPAAHLTINSGGRLNAIGTQAAPIRLTSDDAAGSWRGVNFNGSRSAENVLHHVIIERGGSTGWSGAAYSRSALLLQGNTLVDIRNSTITGSSAQGITVYNPAEMVFENNTLSNNALAAWVSANSVGYMSGNTTFQGNTNNVVQVAFANTDAVTRAQTWQRQQVPYDVQDRIFIEAKLGISPGAIIRFAKDASAIVRNGGAVTAIGTATERIRFTSLENEVPSYWQGVQIATNSADNIFHYVSFQNGGSRAWTGNTQSRAMVYLDGNSKAEFQHSDFSGSGYYALWVPAGGNIAGFEDNTIVENVRALIVHPNRAAAVTGTTRIALNAENRIRVTFGNTDAVTTAQAWAHPATPFYVADRTFVQAALQLMPGTTVEFAQNASLVVNNGGALSVGGTTGTVTMKGGEDLAGYWKGVEYATVSAQNVMSRVDISNAGSQAWFGGANSTGSVNVTGSGSVALRDVRFAKSGGYAAIIASGGAISCSNVDHGGFRYFNRAANAAVSLCP